MPYSLRCFATIGAFALASCGNPGQTPPAMASTSPNSSSTTPSGDTITVDVTEPDRAIAQQVTYRRGVVEAFDLQNPPAAIVGNVIGDTKASAGNFLNATLNINSAPDAQLFTYAAPNLAPSASGNAPLDRTFEMLRSDVSPQTLPAAVQISGTPAVYSSELDPGYELVCNAMGNSYPLPIPGAPTQTAQNAVETWIARLNGSFPSAIWIGTQEPSHTLGYSTSYDVAGCADVPTSEIRAAQADNIQRFIAYWTPIARYLRANHILSGGVQLNAGNDVFYASTASQIMAAQMPLDYFTVQDYTPSSQVDRDLYGAYQAFQQNPSYRNVKVIIDRYGISLTGNPYGTATGMITFLQDEAQLMPYAAMLYGYDVETSGIEGAPTLLPQVLTWLQSAPAPLRPVTSTTSDLQAFALVQKSSPQRAYVALWNVSPSATTHTASIVLNGLSTALSTSNLTILTGSGTAIGRSSSPGITIVGNRIDGLTLGANEFMLVSIHS